MDFNGLARRFRRKALRIIRIIVTACWNGAIFARGLAIFNLQSPLLLAAPPLGGRILATLLRLV